MNGGWDGQDGAATSDHFLSVTKSVGIARHRVTSRTTVTESVSADFIYLLFMGEASVAFVKNNLLFEAFPSQRVLFQQLSAKSPSNMLSCKIQDNLPGRMGLERQRAGLRSWADPGRAAVWQNEGNGVCT